MKRRAFLSLLGAVTASGCSGWHLRGRGEAASLPFKRLAVDETVAEPALVQPLLDQLAQLGVAVDGAADWRLRLGETRWHVSRTAYTLTGDTAAETLSLKQPFELWHNGRQVLRDDAVVYRDHRIDTNALAAAESERRALQNAMRREAVSQILRQLSYVKP